MSKLQCLKCSTEVENSLLCDPCLEADTMTDTTKKCKECGAEAVTLVNGICNTCLSQKDEQDVIDWPKHYNTGKIQPIDAIEDWKLDFRLANAVKYIARHEHKGSAKKDLEKAVWYIQRYIDKELSNE